MFAFNQSSLRMKIERLKNKLIQRELVEAELLVRIRILEESLSYYMKN
jgi:hypothetical protein